MEISQIRYFVATARCMNFTRAADECNVSQPALTRAIRKLEEEMGGPLFRREGRHTHLTELGRMLRPRLEQALELTDLARTEALDFSKMVNAKLDLGVMCTIAPMSVIGLIEFLSRQAPQLNLMLQEASGRVLTERLLNGDLDVALMALPEVVEDLQATPLFSEPYVITFPRSHRFSSMAEVPLRELQGEKYLSRLNCEYLDVFEAEGHEFGYDVDERFGSEHETWIQAMVIAGLGCAVMPRSLAAQPELQSRPLVDPAICRTVSVVTRRGRLHTPVVAFFVDLCNRMDWESVQPLGDATRPDHVADAGNADAAHVTIGAPTDVQHVIYQDGKMT